jgi:hypothetical protein
MSSEMGEYWRDLKEIGQKRRAENREHAPEVLKSAGIPFTSKNDGAHLIIKIPGHTVNFWPGTGKWQFCNEQRGGRGIIKLIQTLKPNGQR